MTFYFKPPRGFIPFHRLEECLKERMCYLRFVSESLDLSECCECFKFEYLTDGSALDRTGHFMLRLFALKSPSLKEFFLESETLLFQKRLEHLDHCQVQHELQTAVRHVREILVTSSPLPKFKQFIQHFLKTCEDIIDSNALQHTFDHDHSQDCQQYTINVPFTLCLTLLVRRELDINGGLVVVPCSKWINLMACLFQDHLNHGISQLSQSLSYQRAWSDDRIAYLSRIVRARFNTYKHSGFNSDTLILLSKDVDTRSAFFPPCMRNFHLTLRHRHRLSHYSRLYYSLFLKDIGMSLKESVQFWSQEYNQSAIAQPSCSHTWQQDCKRLLYSIRHLYGLEGSRRNYHCPSCRQIQTMSQSPASEGGCPFLDFDDDKLMQCLQEAVQHAESYVKSLLLTRRSKGASAACEMYGEMLFDVMIQSYSGTSLVCTTGKERNLLVSSPFQFYSLAGQVSSLPVL